MTTTARKAACVLLAWALVAAGLSVQGSARGPVAKPQREFDYFALSLQWPGTICASTRHCCAKNGCCRYVLRISSFLRHAPRLGGVLFMRAARSPKIVFFFFFSFSIGARRPHAILSLVLLCSSEPLQTFTIHGLWPDYDDGTWPSCCRHTEFDMDKILPLKEKLYKYWPSLYCSSSSTCFSGKGPFWAHEEMLSSGGIQISNGKEYALSDVIDAIKYAFGGSPQIECKKGSIEELRLCFDKDLKYLPIPLEGS
ncbi:hypothetical protein PR202_ga08639 [Eleusine coracana subsp. coracana]|uniref:Uncharacterized protein n=1 Tax=Eleusine coracana subsp. coracana TaxID=191504 RepID=A0AAV5C3T5_ELECO|nr:hypothetical protein PR202_ga08639 [Eleusine coracana subsp. coracana]